MIITRKIELLIPETDKEIKHAFYEKLFEIARIARDAANAASSHLFMLDNSTPYLDEESKDKLVYLGTKGDKSTKQNVAYCLMSNMFKDKMPGITGMLSCLAQIVRKNYQEDRKKGMWKRSLRSYKSNLPIPFSAKAFGNMCKREYADQDGVVHEVIQFSIMNIPFQMRFGRDRSGNRLIVERILSGEYKLCTSSIVCDGKKVFLLMTVDIPQKKVELIEGKKLYAFLDVETPIVCSTEVKSYRNRDSGEKVFLIGSKEEYLYRRVQIQQAVRRCQMNNKYTVGGKGRKRKCQAIDRWHEKEKNYVDSKIHLYSRELINYAIKYKCAEIVLMNQKEKEKKAKEEMEEGKPFLLRNWGYYNLKEKIRYKATMYGIHLTEE